MQAAATEPTTGVHRWHVALAFLASVVIFLAAHKAGLHDRAIIALNNVSWWLAAAVAAALCWRVSRVVTKREQSAWLTFAAASICWCIGQTIWSYFELAKGALPAFPHWMQIFFVLYDWVFVAGLLLLPKPPGVVGFTPRHSGNLALIVCALCVAYVVALMEPALIPSRNSASNYVIAAHCVGRGAMFVTALYLLWSYRWQLLYWPLVFLVIGAGIHAATHVAYVHQMMTESYVPNDWSNVSWLLIFGAYSCAAYERFWQHRYPHEQTTAALQYRERWLEAIIPALLIALMLAMVWSYSEWLSERVAAVTTLLALIFATALGLREVWIQRQEQRLLDALNEVNDGMLTINRELSKSEARYRTLNMQLEHRVTERTLELQQAYRELENFSYAVAHDLKAPLRSIDGFGAMLADGYGDKLDDTGRRYVDRMRRSALRMSELIDDLLAYSRVDRRELQVSTVSIPALIDKVVAEQRDEIDRHGAQVQINVADAEVRADAEGLLMACRNLLQNALKFSGDANPPTIVIDAVRQDAGICIAVRDNGIGFDMSHHEKIFEMFQRLHRADEIPGTGIGLAIVRKAVERMGGRVWATSMPGAGATFYLYVPADNFDETANT